MTQKKFFTAENLAKIALGYLYLRRYTLRDNKKGSRVGVVSSAVLPPIKMNGGL